MEFLWRLSELRTPFGDRVFGFITRFGEETLIIFLVCLTFWCLDKELAYRIGISFFLSGTLVQIAKVSFRIERPWILDENFAPVESAVEHATGYSFPSGHTQTATSLYSSAAFYINKVWVRLVCIALILAVGFSRMYLGVHTPADVAAGMIISFVIASAVNAYLNKYSSRKSDLILSAALTVFAALCFLYPYILYKDGVIALKYASDCTKQAGATLAFAIGFFAERNYIHYSTERPVLYQILVFAAGIAVTLAIKTGLKQIFPETLFFDALRYFLTVIWVTAVYPYIVMKTVKRKNRV